MKRLYTVLLLYPVENDAPETYLAHVPATDACHAEHLARVEAVVANGFNPDMTEDFRCLLVVAGYQDDLRGNLGPDAGA